jgi:predicted enzyme involved in methoxymalonyl-ACP biosynthesis
VLVESGLLQVVENGSTTNNNNHHQTYYRTAEKGWQFLKLYNSIGELANSGSSNSNNHANVSSSSATTAEVTEMMPKDTTVSSVKIIQYKKK